MEKFTLFGELLYLGFVCEKGRCKSEGHWNLRYKKILYKHMDILKQITECLLVNEVTDTDAYILKKFVDVILQEKDIGRYYPITKDTINQLQECNYAIIDSVDLGKSISNINFLMNDIANEIMELLSTGIITNKKKVAMLIRAIHNLPRVYLGNGLQTICNINLLSIEYKDAVEYSFSNMDEETKQKYWKYHNG